MARIVLDGLNHSIFDYRLFVEQMYIGITVFTKNGIPIYICSTNSV